MFRKGKGKTMKWILTFLLVIGWALAGSDSIENVFPIPNIIGLILAGIACFIMAVREEK